MTHEPDPQQQLLDTLATALGDVVRASLDADREAARRVLRRGGRRTLVAAAEVQARRDIVGSAGRRQAATHRLLLVADAARASRLVDHLARLVLTGRVDGGIAAAHTEALVMLARFGEERLHQLAEGPVGPGLDRQFVRCGRCLVDAADRLDHAVPGRRDESPAVACCAALAHTVLQAPRHALRAA
jgi:hypothetical protein